MTRGARGRGLVLAIALAASLFGGVSGARADVSAQGCTAHAVVAVEPGPGPVVICFNGSLTGLQALQLAGANPVTYGFAGQGGAVCQLNGVGNPADSSCLLGPGGQYWAYYRAAPGASGWTYSRAGATSTTVVDGSVEGWRYGTGAAPGFVGYCSMVACAPPATDPPPPTAAPPAPASEPPPTVAGITTPPGSASSGTKAPTKDAGSTGKAGDDSTAKNDDSAKGGTREGAAASDSKESTVQGGKRRQQSDTVEVAAGGGSGGGGGGSSPVGVIVALALVAAGVGGGLWLRRHRRGAAPG